MARIAIDWTKVEMDGSAEPKDVFQTADARIQGIIAGGNAKGTVKRVALPVEDKKFGKAFLMLKDVKAEALDGILAVIKGFGVDAVTDSYNDLMRQKTLAYLQTNYGDLEEVIKDAVKVCIDSLGMDESEAREFVIARRKKSGMRVPGEAVGAESVSA
jgi:hypothetical protein